ncbi:PEP/pyruvate-binding domain-containing protein [Stenoxybacter acetivorans]|uniref:PEP/pyruvate-binding domain-containing protein n=1 Tax=Stenoxybacter acetivorans TaxID=422441 RepID=UPI00068D330F|nr:PEP/pyruvate-binding domain-containing protein [Stenoxybacter acetivorans]
MTIEHTDNWVLPFHAAEAAELRLSGGKGANLARSAQLLPVPEGVIVSSRAYHAFITPIQEEIRRILTQFSGSHAAQSEQLAALILRTPLPNGLEQAIEKALIAADLQTARLAVRSSGTLEDLPGAAFAGQHDTFLGITGIDAVLDAVRRCYASLWNERVLPYRERLQVSHFDASMAVVLQRMVAVRENEAAGVAFSIDPVRGQLSEVLIDAAFGLGESVVGGEAAVDEFRVHRDDLNISERVIAHKSEAIVSLSADGSQGTRTIPLPPDLQDTPALTDTQIRQVAHLALAAEQYCGFPQDIEWAFSNNTLYLLQTRPITRIPPHFTRDESAERFPNAVTPMTWELVEEGFHASLNHSFALMGLPPFGDKWFAMKDYYIYGNQNAVQLYGGRLPAGLGDSIASLADNLPKLAAQYAWVQNLPILWMRDLDTYLIGIGTLMHEPLDDKTLPQLWDYVLRVRDLGRDYFLPNIAISLTQRSLYVLLNRLLRLVLRDDAAAQQLFDTLLAQVDTKTAQVNDELRELARMMRADSTLFTQVQNLDGRGILAILPKFPTFEREFTVFLQRHGHRELDFDAYCPTWIDAPHTVLDQIKALLQHIGSTENEARDPNAPRKIAAAEAELQLLAQIPENLRYAVREIIRMARVYTELDDLEHYQTTRLTLPFRRALSALGNKLLAKGILDAPDDVYFCPASVMVAALQQNDLSQIRATVYQHKAAYEQAKNNAPTWIYGEADTLSESAEILTGLGGSAGVTEGETFVIHSPDDFAHFPRNAVLVARTTNPAWTPLFYQAIAVITESGGPLSHGAVTARELGLPAVMGVRHACTLLPNGTKVRVNGSAGTVAIVEAVK